jgi:thiol:disulfide interchange protein DsbG
MTSLHHRFLLPLLAACALVACKDSPGPAGAPATEKAAAATTPVTLEAITAEAQGFSVGPTMAARTAYVFFDPQCPHCAALWVAAKPLKSQTRFVWIPVGLLNEASTKQGAALLAAADPVAAMDEHEASMRAKGGGISAGGSDAQRAAVGKNTALMNRFGLGSVPTIVGKHAQTGEVVVVEGAVPTATLAAKLGLQAPSGS